MAVDNGHLHGPAGSRLADFSFEPSLRRCRTEQECNRDKETGILWVVGGSHHQLQSDPAAKVSEWLVPFAFFCFSLAL